MNSLSSRRLVLASLACLAFLVFEGVASPTLAACNAGDVQHPESTICGGVFENGFTWVSFGTSTEGAFGEPASEGYIIIEDDGLNTPICLADGTITGTGSAITAGTAVSAITFGDATTIACQGTSGASGSWYPFQDSGDGVWAVKIPTDRTVPADYTLVACNSTDTFSTSSGCAAAASGPEINVKDDAASSVANGGTLTISPNPVGGSSTTEVLTIENTGTAALTLGTPTTSNTSNASVTSAVLASTTVAADGSTTLTITYTPTSSGAFSFDLDIPSDDSDEATYDIALSGTASASVPEINVKDDAASSVADGGTLTISPNPVGGTSTTEVLTIENTGTATLTLATPTTSNTSNATITSAVLASSTVAADGSTTLTRIIHHARKRRRQV